MQRYENAVEWLKKWDTFSLKLGMERMAWMMEKLGHPERLLRSVHIGGTNGKGSTLTFLESILRQAGYSVGTFTSPSLGAFNERIKKDGKPVTDEALCRAIEMVRPHAEALGATEHGEPTEFEVITAVAIVYFAKIDPCDFVLFEVGLGGLHDSTNVLLPMLTIITNVGWDHVEQLGPTLADIAREKAGIIKPGVPVITGAEGEAETIIQTTAAERRAKLYRLGYEFQIDGVERTEDGEVYDFRSPFSRYERLTIRMAGRHQVINAALAVMAADYLRNFFAVDIEEEALRDGLKRAFWPGRFEKISERPLVILDGAHNPDGMRALADEVRRRYPNRRLHLLFAAFKDKDCAAMLAELNAVADRVVLTTFDHPRASRPSALMSAVPEGMRAEEAGDWQTAYHRMLEVMTDEDMLLITGSLHFVGMVRQALGVSDPPLARS